MSAGKLSKSKWLYFFIGVLAILIILFVSFAPRAHYTRAYIEENRGKVIAEIPEVFELANIIIAIANHELTNNPYSVFQQGEYYERVLQHFLPFKNHPLISEIRREFSGEDQGSKYYRFRDNSVCYVFKGDSIVNAGLYSVVFSPDLFKEYIDLVEDFARVSGFREFYDANQSYYQEQIQKYKERVPVKKMWDWLENNFPQRYDCYKVIFSPLIQGMHHTERFETKKFKEIVMFICGPDAFHVRLPEKIEEGLLSRAVFTEIDHNYVNPITKKYSDKVEKAFSDIQKWNKQSRYWYTTPVITFNEYMTWAVFTLYAYDTYEKEDFEIINQFTVNQMVNSRGFVLFEQFNNQLLELYINREEGEAIPDLYPEILEWVENYL